MKKRRFVVMLVVCLCASSIMADIVPGVSSAPLAYMPFENTDGTYGPGTGSNPAWENVVNDEQPRIVDRGVTLWPEIASDGVKGDALDFSSMGSGSTDILTYDSTSGGATASALDGVVSQTITFWLRSSGSQVQAAPTLTYLMRGTSQIYWTTDGRIGSHYWPGLDWKASNPGDYDSYGEWLFVGITFDSAGMKMYKGDLNNAPTLVAEHSVATTAASCGALYLGGRTYVGAAYIEADMDELRMWGSKTDGSGALSANDITDVWSYDSPVEVCDDPDGRFVFGDLNYDCLVNFDDLTIFSSYWLADNTAYESGDIDLDQNTNYNDFSIMASNWLESAFTLQVSRVDSLDRVFCDMPPVAMSYSDPISTPRGGRVPFQFSLYSPEGGQCEISVSSIQRTDSVELSGGSDIYHLIPVHVEGNREDPNWTPEPDQVQYYLRLAPFDVTEVLISTSTVQLDASKYHSILLDVNIPVNSEPGIYSGTIKFSTNGLPVEKTFSIRVHSTIVTDELDIGSSCWLWPTPEDLSTRQTTPELWSEEHWQLLETAGITLRKFEQNTMLSPSICGDYPLIQTYHTSTPGVYGWDYTNFDRWVEMFSSLGFELFEGGHLATRGNVPYTIYSRYNGSLVKIFDRYSDVNSYLSFLEDFFDNLYQHLTQKGWADIYAQHLTDEPIDAVSYSTLTNLCNLHMPGIPTIDAIHSWGQDPYQFLGIADYWIFSIGLLDGNPAVAADHQGLGKKVWFYDLYITTQANRPHRLLDAPLSNSRANLWFVYHYNSNGTLRWAANVYRGADPYTRSMGPRSPDGGYPAHPPGENWQYYPTEDGLVGSMRMVAYRDGIIDLKLLKQLSLLDKSQADAFALQVVRALEDYETEPAVYHNMRRSILEELDSY